MSIKGVGISFDVFLSFANTLESKSIKLYFEDLLVSCPISIKKFCHFSSGFVSYTDEPGD